MIKSKEFTKLDESHSSAMNLAAEWDYENKGVPMTVKSQETSTDKAKQEEATKKEATTATEKQDEKKDSHSEGGCCGVCG